MRGALVGRVAERAAFHEAITTPGPAVVLVAGEAGVGKTTFVEDVVAGGVPGTVLRGRAVEWPAAAYDVLARALRPALSGAGEQLRAMLAEIVPELGAPPATPDPAGLARAVCAAASPGVLFLDDLQWADEATLSLLPAVADAAAGAAGPAGVAGPAVRIVGCYRSDELARGHLLRSVRAQLRKRGQLAEITLSPLSDERVRELIGALLGAEPGPALVAAVASRADGLPFAVEELVAALRDGGRLTYHAGTVTLAGEGTGPVPDGIREAVLLRASRLTGTERMLLDAAAVAGGEFDVDTAALAASAIVTGSDPAPVAWPDGFTAAGLLTEAQEGHAAFRHALTHAAAYADIPWSRRRRLHRALASAAAAGEGGQPALVARHLLAACDYAAASGALIRAADAYCAVHAYRDAARALRTALEHWPGDYADGPAAVRRMAVVERLARCAEMCSEYADAVTLLRELADGYEQQGNVLALAGTYRRIALAYELRGHWDPALAAREKAAGAYAKAGRGDEAAVDRLAVAVHLRAAASYSAALATLAVAAADARHCDRADLRLRVDGLRGNILSRLGDSAGGIVVVRAALAEALGQNLPDTAAELHHRLADTLEHSGNYPAATAAYSAAYQYCDSHGRGAIGQLCRVCVSAVLFSRGEWDRAAAICQDVLAQSDATTHARAVGACILGLVHSLRGEVKAARPHLLEASVLSARSELAAAELLSTWGLAVIEEHAGALGAAGDRARDVLTRLRRTQECHYCVPVLQWAASFFTDRGLTTDARACATALATICDATAQPEAVATLAHAIGETLLPEDPAAAARELRRAAEMFSELELPFAMAQARYRAGIAAAAAGDDRAARELLVMAQQTAAKLGAQGLLGGCAGALTRLGVPAVPLVPAARRPPDSLAGLTAREMDVMALVADGNTSRQVGATLFISPRTVEMHVQGCLLKLGCRTRAEAVRKLAERGALPR
jgi:DNA-binding CsgD family transcriptional regulator/tetratricopeptide (TPR) repeat protein